MPHDIIDNRETKLADRINQILAATDSANLKDYFKLDEAKEKSLQDVLVHVLIRRTRTHILRWYGLRGAIPIGP